MIGIEEWFSLMSFIYVAVVVAVVVCLLVLGFRFVRAVERFVSKMRPIDSAGIGTTNKTSFILITWNS